MAQFGKDHWGMFAFVECRAVDDRGRLDFDRMRVSAQRHPGFMAARRWPADGAKYPTRVKDTNTAPVDGRFAAAEVPDHDDVDCLDDLLAAGLLTVTMPHRTPDGGFADAHGRPTDSSGLVSGLEEQRLSAYAVWGLTAAGLSVASQLRAFKAAGGRFHDFEAASG